MKIHNAASLLLLPLLFSACQDGPPSITHPPLDPTLDEPAPRSLVTSMNINPDPDAGPESSALYIVNPETGDLHVHPFSTMRGGPVPGQGMHTALTADRETVFCTWEEMSIWTSDRSPSSHWQNGHPHPEVLKANPRQGRNPRQRIQWRLLSPWRPWHPTGRARQQNHRSWPIPAVQRDAE